MLHIVNLEEIQGHLLRVPGLIQDLEEWNPEFCDSVKEWMGIQYDFEKKTFSLYLYYVKNSKSKNIAKSAEKNSTSKKQKEEK
jgi:hypothetical protein